MLLQPATEVAALLRRRELSAREVTESLLTRIDKVNPVLNAVVELRGDEAVRAAGEADQALARGDDVGPLHG
ncbi:MAG: amidase, partial [Propionibacteriales bacterium]|nr:amidase [Propionibacteriales bacterium]